MVNPVVEQCWQVRAKLVKQLGGLDGLFDEMQRLDRKRLAAVASKKNAKRATTTAKKSPTSKRSKSN